MDETEILLEAIQRIIECETIEQARDEAYDAMFLLSCPDEELITL